MSRIKMVATAATRQVCLLSTVVLSKAEEISRRLRKRRGTAPLAASATLRFAKCPLLIGEERVPMSHPSKHQILVVDDEPRVRESLTMLLASGGYDVITAENGFDALLQLRRSLPDVIISDLNMPQMSGFELLSVVRRRFPEISVMAMSGAYTCSEDVPGGVIADAFYAKEGGHPEGLFSAVADLIRTSASRASAHQKASAPVWIPRNGKDSNGVPYIVVTCTECLRSFPLNVPEEPTPEVCKTACLFCPNTVRYIIDFSRSVGAARRPMPRSGNGPPFAEYLPM